MPIDVGHGIVHTGLVPTTLTESTVIRPLANGFVAAYEPGQVAKLFAPAEQNRCGWLYRASFSEICPPSCECEGAHGEIWAEAGPEGIIMECNAPAVQFDNGWACAHGHDHFYGQQYATEDEIDSARRAGNPYASVWRLA